MSMQKISYRENLKIPTTSHELLEFLSLDRKTVSELDRQKIWEVYQTAYEGHKNQFRESGELYITHPLEVARMVAELGLDIEAVSAALCHDLVEDTSISLQYLEERFGPNISNLVRGVTKLNKYALPEKEKRDAETIRRLFIAMISDVRVMVIKLCDRLHNLRTLESLNDLRKRQIATETLEIYAPIAERLGMWTIKSELEDLSFKYINPKEYKNILHALQRSQESHKTILNELIENVKKKMIEFGFRPNDFEITGRTKHIYSIYKKLHTPKYEGKGVERIYDKIGIRIIVPDIQDCYAVLGIIHSEWQPIPGEFDDYIGIKLPSGYQSLHTAVKYGAGFTDVVEFQIRTFKMHYDAEYGIAAHWVYKENGKNKIDIELQRKINWLRQTIEDPQPEDTDTFIELLKSDVLQDRVYVFTPRGDIIDLPTGATPIDFAYHVHTDIGHRCRGAKVNGKLVSLDHPLKTGDQVEILTSKQGGPSRDWLNTNLGLVRTQRARAKIRAWFKKQDRQQNLDQGRQLLERELDRLGLSNVSFEELAHDMELRSADDMFVGIGCGDISLSRLINLLSSKYVSAAIGEETIPISAPRRDTSSSDSVSVVGLKGLLTTMAKCCNPTPGDEIIGFITRGRGCTVHRQDCPNILRMKLDDRERLVRVSWGENVRTYPVPIRVLAYDRAGLMGDISNLINNEGVNIVDVSVRMDRDKIHADVANIRLIVEVRDLEQLARILTRIENLPNVMEAVRIRGG